MTNRPMVKKLVIATLILTSTLGATMCRAGQQSGKPATLGMVPCEIQGIEGKARCGDYAVFENRATKKGRKIRLKIVVLPATGVEHAPDPFVYIAGGPGSSAIEDAPGIAQAFQKIREKRDLVFVDQRGTGGSNPLNCDFFNPADAQSYLGYFFPLDDVKKCRQQLEGVGQREKGEKGNGERGTGEVEFEGKVDLTLYTTPIAMDDLDEVRAALGYERINIFGASYGTRAALVYLKRHPTSVRTLMLQGVAPTNEYMPLAFAQSNERALMGIIGECASDGACNKAFPNLSAETKAVLERLLQGPIEVEVRFEKAEGSRQKAEGRQKEAGGQERSTTTKVKLSRDLAAEAIRYMLYSPSGASRVPLMLHTAAQGNFGPLAEAALNYRRNLVGTGSNGLYLSITCAEDLPWIKAGEGERLAANTFLGDYRLRQQREACALWPRATIPTDYRVPTKGSAPVLILTGEWDPVTPPSNGDAVAKHLPNSLHFVVPDGAHGFGALQGLDCIQRLSGEFVESGTVKGLDTSCVKNIRRRGFITK
jgi:pimeloyl-ACP methyl ester carboxylesterase